jgi:hypothetical protein
LFRYLLFRFFKRIRDDYCIADSGRLILQIWISFRHQLTLALSVPSRPALWLFWKLNQRFCQALVPVLLRALQIECRLKRLPLPYENFPWFKESKLADILKVELYSGGHIYWPALDVDLSTTILENPERFPLKSKKSN